MTAARFRVGHQVGEIARDIYDPERRGELILIQKDNLGASIERTRQLLATPQPIFEAGLSTPKARAFADVMLPVTLEDHLAWRLVEVKSSTAVKEYHLDDAAIQAYIAIAAGVPLAGISIAVIDNRWVYPGGGDYAGLLTETDVTEQAERRQPEVQSWIEDAQAVVSATIEPPIRMGRHCVKPFECSFSDYCRGLIPQARHPIAQLPGKLRKELAALVEAHELIELADVPDHLLTGIQLRVKDAALSGTASFDEAGAAATLAPHKLPAYFMDFETIQFAVPIWQGTRPYQQIPFQFSLHSLSDTGELTHHDFLDASGADPSQAFAAALVAAVGKIGPVFVYNAGFESARIKELAARFPEHDTELQAILERLVDLLPVARNHYCSPSQQGSWSIKAVLPALFPDLNYGSLVGVQDGTMAMEVFLEALSSTTSIARKAEIEGQLRAYCCLDTYALVRLWAAFSGAKLEMS